jgi:hypothetical protein
VPFGPLVELSEGQIDRDEKFWFEAVHVNAMIAVVEAEAVAAAPELRDWLLSLVAFARRAADRHAGVVFVISCSPRINQSLSLIFVTVIVFSERRPPKYL